MRPSIDPGPVPIPTLPRDNFAFLRDALRAAASRPPTADSLALAIRAWARGTTETYLGHLRPLALLHARSPSLSHSEAVAATLRDMAVASRSSTVARGLLAAVRQLETLGLLPAVVSPQHWAMARALHSLSAPSPPQLWATADLLLFLAHSATSPVQSRVVCLANLSFAQLLRVGEAASIRPQDLSGSSLSFFDEKVARAWITVPLGQWAAAWADRLSTLPTAATDAGGPFAPSRQHLQQSLHSLLAGSPWAPFTWHSFRRMGAAALSVAGTPMAAVCAWGRWHSQSVASRYVRHPPGWQFPSPVLLPWPSQGPTPYTFEIRPTLPEHIWPPSLVARRPGTSCAPRHSPRARCPRTSHDRQGLPSDPRPPARPSIRPHSLPRVPLPPHARSSPAPALHAPAPAPSICPIAPKRPSHPSTASPPEKRSRSSPH